MDKNLELTDEQLEVKDDQFQVLLEYFISPFVSSFEYDNFFHQTNLKFNVCYSVISELFAEKSDFHNSSIKLAKYLLERSDNHFIKKGEFYCVYFSDLIVDGKEIDAIGLFKSETKEKFIKVSKKGGLAKVVIDEGAYVNKVDKAAIIFNVDKKEGFQVLSIDRTNKSNEARFWVNDFLGLRPAADDFHNTGTVMDMARLFITKTLPDEFDVSKVSKADYMNRSVEYFKTQDQYKEEEFVQEVFRHPEVVESFDRFREQYVKENDINPGQEFDISRNAVKKKYSGMRSVLKLDKNFHVYIHGDTSLIENGFDEKTGKKYYKIFYDTEL